MDGSHSVIGVVSLVKVPSTARPPLGAGTVGGTVSNVNVLVMDEVVFSAWSLVPPVDSIGEGVGSRHLKLSDFTSYHRIDIKWAIYNISAGYLYPVTKWVSCGCKPVKSWGPVVNNFSVRG